MVEAREGVDPPIRLRCICRKGLLWRHRLRTSAQHEKRLVVKKYR